VLIDICVIAMLAIVVLLLSERFEIYVFLDRWILKHSVWNVDDLVVVGAFLAFAMGVFALRRYMEISKILKERELTMVELRDAKERAEAASKAKGEFLANMSHEIRTPMNGIIGMTDLTLDTQLTDEQREYLRLVKSSAASLLQILNDVLDFSKIEAGRMELEPAPFSLSGVLADTVKSLNVRAQEKGLELTQRISPSLPDLLVGDPLRLRQVIVNLLGNAIKFTERGEVALEVTAHSVNEDSVRLRFSIRDTGIGIPYEQQRNVFGAFTQADNSATRRYGGTGLGLTISAQLVALMHGRIWLESIPGTGSTFHFTARFGRQPVLASHKTPKIESLREMRVLVVDDNATNRRWLQELAGSWDMRPTCVESGAEALGAMTEAAAEGNPFPLVLLDAVMPEMDGFAVAERIRSEPSLATSTVMMLSSSDRTEDARRCRALGVSAYLHKPITGAELLASIMSVMGIKTPDTREPRTLEASPSISDGRHLRILLAEDNVVNQRVAVRVLEKRGHWVVIAENGVEALQALACQRFDLALMDVQMPEMDGLEATRRIRAMEEQTGQHLPIVAMTAHAMKGDRERCLQAGMDDYIAKPIDAKKLAALVERLVPLDELSATLAEARRKQAEPEFTISQSPVSALPPVQNAADNVTEDTAPTETICLKSLEERVENDIELIQEMVELFLDNAPMLLAEIEAGLADGDLRTVQRATHSLRGAASNLCAAPCVQTAERLEMFSKNGDIGEVETAVAELRDELAKLQSALQSMFKTTTPAAASAGG
jgi:signal transduction histidine kinase/CheY-like chemotaxis protein